MRVTAVSSDHRERDHGDQVGGGGWAGVARVDPPVPGGQHPVAAGGVDVAGAHGVEGGQGGEHAGDQQQVGDVGQGDPALP